MPTVSVFSLTLVIWAFFLPGQVAADTKTVSLAMDESPPYSYQDKNGVYKGLNVDIARLLVTKLGLNLEFVDCPWARCVDLVKSGQVDLLMGISKNPERERHFHFIEPAFFRGQMNFGFFIRHGQPVIQTYQDLAPLIIGSLRGSKHFPRFDNDKTLKKIETTDIKTAINMLQVGHIDTFVHLTNTLQPYLEQYDPGGLISQAEFSHNVNTYGFIALSKKSGLSGRIDEFNQALALLDHKGVIQKAFTDYGVYLAPKQPEGTKKMYSQKPRQPEK